MQTLIGRRAFGLKLGKSAIAMYMFSGLAAIYTAGCNFVSDVKAWVPVGVAAFNQICNLLESSGFLSVAAGTAGEAAVGLVSGAFNQVLAAIAAYQAITPAPVGAKERIVAALQVVVAQFQAFLSSLTISDAKIVSLVTGFANIILSTIAGFEGTADVPQGSLVKSHTAMICGKALTFTPQQRTVGQFKKDFNACAVQWGHPELKLKLSFFEHF